MKTETSKLQALARQVGLLKPQSATEISLVGLMAGALYSLLAAAEVNYDDARAVPTSPAG